MSIPPDIPVEITDLAYDMVPGGIQNLQYGVRNNGSARLVAVEVLVDVTDGKIVSRSPQYWDTWLVPGGGLVPGATENPMGNSLSVLSKTATPVQVTLTVASVQFADGTMMGDKEEQFRRFLKAKHEKVKAEYRRVESALDSLSESQARALLTDRPTNESVRVARTFLSEALRRNGISGLRDEISRVKALTP